MAKDKAKSPESKDTKAAGAASGGEGGTGVHKIHSPVSEGEKVYGPGDEAAFAAATDDKPAGYFKRLADLGVLEGFGTYGSGKFRTKGKKSDEE